VQHYHGSPVFIL